MISQTPSTKRMSFLCWAGRCPNLLRLSRRSPLRMERMRALTTDTAVATDDEGYGLTYLFGDGWVKYADTKQSIALVEWPRD